MGQRPKGHLSAKDGQARPRHGDHRIADIPKIAEHRHQDTGIPIGIIRANAKYDAQGNLTEVSERTGIWAWKHYHKADNTTTYQLMEGDVVFDHVDFGYTEDKGPCRPAHHKSG